MSAAIENSAKCEISLVKKSLSAADMHRELYALYGPDIIHGDYFLDNPRNFMKLAL